MQGVLKERWTREVLVKNITRHGILAVCFASAGLFTGCERSADSFSLLSDGSAFKQSEDYVQRKIDILWVIDNSGSMANSQANLAANFQSFISRFSQLNYDFHMGVTTTDAYLAHHYNNNNRSRLRDGVGSNLTGVRIIDRDTPNLTQTFITNMTQGINGNGDERAFSSFLHALNNPLNAGFLRPGAFLSIIIVSDEDDFSHMDWQNGVHSYFFTENYNHPSIFSIQHFVDKLDELTDSEPGGIRNYSVSTISIMDAQCLADLNQNSQKVSQRYQQLADATGGTKGSLCGDFGSTLQMISDKVIELSTVFKLSREPIKESIRVFVDGVEIPESAANGWTYDAANWSISFHGSAVPAAGSDVQIGFDPASVKL